MPTYQGGPLAGQIGYSQQAGDPPADQLAAQFLGAGGGGSADSEAPGQDQGGDQLSASQKFDRIISDARSLAASDGDFSEEDKLILEQVTTLLQKLKAKGEKDVTTALSGRMSPAVGKAYAGAGG